MRKVNFKMAGEELLLGIGLLPFVLCFAAVAFIALIYIVMTYNRLVSLRNRVENAWAQIDVQLKRRYDLIPNLVETVKGYMKHERGTFEAITKYRVMDRTPGYSLLEIELQTGRKNQIRVHLAEMGCPVVGDRRYGADATYERRIRLHAFYLSLNHPLTGARVDVKSKMPKGFLVLKNENEKYK